MELGEADKAQSPHGTSSPPRQLAPSRPAGTLLPDLVLNTVVPSSALRSSAAERFLPWTPRARRKAATTAFATDRGGRAGAGARPMAFPAPGLASPRGRSEGGALAATRCGPAMSAGRG